MAYEFLTSENIPAYIASKSSLNKIVNPDKISNIAEVGDGNLNLVFIIHDSDGGTLVLKQALPYVRLVGPDWPMTPSRAEHEAEALRIHGELDPKKIPVMFDYDPDRFIIAMENLASFRVWRGAMIEGLRHEGVAEAMGELVAEVAFGTSVLGLASKEQKESAAASINPELCRITEDLVFTEPYHDIGRNKVLPENQPDADKHAADADMRLAMADAKWIFMTKAEALIHGDLHSGSIMVRALDGSKEGPAEARAFDSEFAFYGPIAFDIGAMWANFTLSAARHIALGDEAYANWALELITKSWNSFEATIRAKVNESNQDPMWTAEFLERRLADWMIESWLFAAAKMSRRIVGLAKVHDIEALEPRLREGAARGILELSREIVRHRKPGVTTKQFEALALETLKKHSTR